MSCGVRVSNTVPDVCACRLPDAYGPMDGRCPVFGFVWRRADVALGGDDSNMNGVSTETEYVIRAEWDEDSGVWWLDTDLPGLPDAVETYDELFVPRRPNSPPDAGRSAYGSNRRDR